MDTRSVLMLASYWSSSQPPKRGCTVVYCTWVVSTEAGVLWYYSRDCLSRLSYNWVVVGGVVSTLLQLHCDTLPAQYWAVEELLGLYSPILTSFEVNNGQSNGLNWGIIWKIVFYTSFKLWISRNIKYK